MERSAKQFRLTELVDSAVVSQSSGDATQELPAAYIWEGVENNLNLISDNQWNDFFFHPLLQNISSELSSHVANHTGKRTYNDAFSDKSGPQELPVWVGLQFPEFFPTLPRLESRVDQMKEQNPFAAENDFSEIHPSLQRTRTLVPKSQLGVVDALIKCRFSPITEKKKNEPAFPLRDRHEQKPKDVARLREPGPLDIIPQLPPSFGDVARFSSIDRELFKFYIRAICAGRTIVPNENTYLREIAPMVGKNDCVRHAILSLAATYVLDYVRNEQLEARANFHHQRALYLFSMELKNRENWSPGKECPLIATIIIFSHNEVVNWEIDRLKEASPRWYRGSKLAERILDMSDPGYHFHYPRNVQCTPARLQLASCICLDTVMSACVHPLDPNTSKCSYPWLLEGTELEQRKIVGFNGLSSKLMHYFAKITHLCARLCKNPSSEVVPLVGKAIEDKLENFWQWSDLSQGYDTSEALLASCELDENGKVTTGAKVTELIGESYVAAAQIYLQCRLFCRPREDPVVQLILQRLLLCIDRQPTSGPLFTAQTPLFSVFIGGIVAYQPRDRDIIRDYFLPTCSDSRGNILPCWRAIRHVWDWLDSNDFSEIGKNGDFDSMWEQVIAELTSKAGIINLS